MMRQMRANVKWIMAFVALSFVGWMIFEVGMDVTGSAGPTMTDEILRIDGTKIDAQTFYAAVRNAQEQQRQAGSPVITLEDQRELEDRVIESMVEQILLRNEYERRGIRVTDDEIRQAAENSPPPELFSVPEFQTEGQFDLAKYQRYLRAQTDPQFLFSLEARYRDEIPRSKLFDQITADIYVPNAKLWQIYRDEHDSVEARLMTLLPAAVVKDDEVALDDAALQAYYRQHRDEYRRPKQVFLSFVAVSRQTNQADSAAARARADDIVQELRDGANFADVAARESADSVSRANGGDLGELRLGQTDPTFEQAALALRPGQISDPVLTQFGYHIIKLESKTSDGFQAAHILVPIELQGDHLDLVDERGDSLDFMGAEQQDPTALDSVASAMGLAVQTAPGLYEGDRLRLTFFDQASASVIAGTVPDVGVWAFESPEGETSPVIETEQAFYLFRLDSLTAEGIPSLAAVRADVERDARMAEKWTRTERLADEIDRELREGASLEDVASPRGLNVVTLPPFTRINPSPAIAGAPEAVGAAFGLDAGEVSGPVKGERAIYFVESLARHPADSTAWLAQIEEQRSRIIQQARQVRVRLILASLRRKANIIDRRQELALAQRQQADLPFPTNPLGF